MISISNLHHQSSEKEIEKIKTLLPIKDYIKDKHRPKWWSYHLFTKQTDVCSDIVDNNMTEILKSDDGGIQGRQLTVGYR